MSEEGQWTLENDRCTYNGPCHLELELKSSGSTIRLPSQHTQLEASFTLPSSRPPRELTLSETRIPGIQVIGESSTTQRRCSDDLNSLPYVRAARRSRLRRRRCLPPRKSSSPWTTSTLEGLACTDIGLQ
ncbi:unnamed protein product [Lupinus luteus]|uniref:Uncharacterized protein n=1 Tax=Lupinus luteus TaxID=3873 RepID=A0AAV1Y347_LUPLU